MLEELVEWMKQLAVFMVLCETILSFAPTLTYRRYIKPFIGLILLFRIVAFCAGISQTDWNGRVEEVLEQYERSISSYLDDPFIVDDEFEKEKLNEELIKIDEIRIGEIEIGEEGK